MKTIYLYYYNAMYIMMSHIPFYLQLRIEAYDQGTPPKTNTTVAIVSVTRNFYEPAFNSTSYNVRIPETKQLGDVIIRTYATDADVLVSISGTTNFIVN